MKNRFLIFLVSSFIIGILFSFSMLCYASTTTSNSSVSKAQYTLRQNLKQNGTGKKKVCKEFNRIKDDSEHQKLNMSCSSALHNSYNITDYNTYYENKNRYNNTVAQDFSTLEEIRTIRLLI